MLYHIGWTGDFWSKSVLLLQNLETLFLEILNDFLVLLVNMQVLKDQKLRFCKPVYCASEKKQCQIGFI